MAESAEEDADSPFEMFTKDPKAERPPPAASLEPEKEEEPFEQIFDAEDIGGAREESPDAVPPNEGDLEGELEDEMHVFDLAEDVEEFPQTQAVEAPPPEPEPAPVREEPVFEPAVDPVVEPVVAPVFESAEAAIPAHDVPAVDMVVEKEPEGAPPAVTPPREEVSGGAFDTETLAGLYVSQGFYDKAVDVYRRMLRDRPEDVSLRQKLEEALSLQRMAPAAAAAPEPAPAQEPAPAAEAPYAVDTGEDPVIVELRRFLAQLKERQK